MLSRYPYSSILREMERLQNEMNRLFGSFPSWERIAPSYPAMNMWVNEESIILTAELPGVQSENLDIQVVGDTLKLSGERKAEDLPEGARVHRRERGCGKFTRAIQLPYEIDADKIEAVFEKGVLKVTLPRAEASKPRKITVKAG